MIDFSQQPWGLVLAGGGGKGSYQVGVFKALFEYNIFDKIVAISGSSVGAINGALFSTGNQHTVEAAWDDITPEKMLGPDISLIDGHEGFVSRDGMNELIDNYLNLEEIADSDKTIYVSTCNFGRRDTGDSEINYFTLNKKEPDMIRKLILATSALPAIYEPVLIDGEIHKDGGLLDNLPIKPLYDMGIRHFIVVELHQRDIPEELFPGAKFVFIRPSDDIGEFVDGTLDFTKAGVKRRSELGYYDAKRVLELTE